MQVRIKAFNPQIFLEFLCYSVFGVSLLYLVSSGNYLSYVAPRMEPYLYFTIIVMGLWALAGLGRLFRPQHKVRSAHLFVLVIPILLLVLPHRSLSTSDFSGNYAGGNAFFGLSGQSFYDAPNKRSSSGSSGLNASSGTPAGSPVENSATLADEPSTAVENDLPVEDVASADSFDTTVDTVTTEDTMTVDSIDTAMDTITADSADATAPDIQNDVPEDEYSLDLHGLDEKNKTITVANDDFGLWLAEIYENMEKYKGYRITMTGFVFKDPEILTGGLAENQFIPARLMMACCVADLVPCGLICQYDGASELKADSWVTVEGTLYIGKYQYDDGEECDDPQISVTKITPAEAVEGYVYPY